MYRKKDIFITIQLLREAVSVIEKQILNMGEEEKQAFLSDCQQAAIEMGEFFETQGDYGEKCVKILEEYCEKIYQISIDNQSEFIRKSVKVIKKQLIDIENIVRQEMPEDKKRIVFLPYKVAMWDSMESIWAAAKEDFSCETYVIPIPYYEKNKDGTLGKMHSERDKFPSYVQTENWENVDLSALQPDAVYIHNPYDDSNLVTSVHPAYYSDQLRNYTKMLVYVPYFVAVNDKVNTELCLTPGVLFADKVMLQSEEVKQQYINVFAAFEKEHNCRGIFGDVRTKFVAAGSPKYDMVFKSISEDAVPKSWKLKLVKQDGSRKKVVFYNTSIQALLDGKEQYIDKVKQVLQMFYEKKEDILLLWRPHPLLMSTVTAMLPELQQQYEKLVNDYVTGEWGIYDVGADLQCAIDFSDAYYGDNSSIVELFSCREKPIMIQNVNVK